MENNTSTCEISVEHFRNSIRLRWRYSKERFSLTVGKFSKSTIAEAKDLSTIISTDIDNGKFDFSLNKYEALLKKNQQTPCADQPFVETKESNFPVVEKPVISRNEKVVNKNAQGSTVSVLFLEWMETMNPVPFNVATTQKMVARWGVISFVDVPKKLIKAELAAVTFNNRLNILRRFFKWLKKNKHITSNPIEDVENRRERHKGKRSQRRPFDDDEIRIIQKALRTNRFSKSKAYPHSTYYPFVKFIFDTGVRNAEAIGLKVNKVNFRRKFITIDQAFARTSKGCHVKARVLKSTKTTNSRNIPLTRELVKLLKPLCEGRKPDDFVFVNAKGNPIDDRMFQRRVFKPVLMKLGIEERDLYALRHTFGTVCVEQNINPLDGAYLMGHRKARTMIENYAHLRRIPKKLPKVG